MIHAGEHNNASGSEFDPDLFYVNAHMLGGALTRNPHINHRYPAVVQSGLDGLGNFGHGWIRQSHDPRGIVLKSFIGQLVELVGEVETEPTPANERANLLLPGEYGGTSLERISLLSATACMVAGAVVYTSEGKSQEKKVVPDYPESLTSTFRSLYDYGQEWLETPNDPRAVTLRSFATQLDQMAHEAELGQE